jgi:hypothetical protein
VGRFPEPGDEELLAGPSRNFQIFDPLDFLAEVTQHIPAPGEHLIRYYGWYSNKTRGQRAQRQPAAAAGTGIPARSPSAREARQGWAALIKRVYEADPLCCPKCGTTMRIIAFLERRQTEVIRRRSSSYGGTSREDSPALWALGGDCRPGPTAAGGSGRGLTEQETQEKAGALHPAQR